MTGSRLSLRQEKSGRVLAVLIVLSVLSVLSGCRQPSGPTSTFRDYQGNELSRFSEHSPWLIVSYWAIWCKSCREEIPELNALAKADNGIQVWGVDFDNPTSVAELDAKVDKLGIAFPVLAPASVPQLALEMPPVLPASYIIAPDGSVKERLLGSYSMIELQDIVHRLKSG